MPQTTGRCPWCGTDPLYVHYHDTVWGRPEYDDQALFEKLCGADRDIMKGCEVVGLIGLGVVDHVRRRIMRFERPQEVTRRP